MVQQINLEEIAKCAKRINLKQVTSSGKKKGTIKQASLMAALFRLAIFSAQTNIINIAYPKTYPDGHAILAAHFILAPINKKQRIDNKLVS